jgi:hypothetical protein
MSSDLHGPSDTLVLSTRTKGALLVLWLSASYCSPQGKFRLYLEVQYLVPVQYLVACVDPPYILLSLSLPSSLSLSLHVCYTLVTLVLRYITLVIVFQLQSFSNLIYKHILVLVPMISQIRNGGLLGAVLAASVAASPVAVQDLQVVPALQERGSIELGSFPLSTTRAKDVLVDM